MGSELPELAANATVLRGPLQDLEALGLHRPATLSLGQYLRVLVDQGLLPAEPTEAYLLAYQAVRYGGKEIPTEQLEQVADRLRDELERWDQTDKKITQLQNQLQKLPVPAPVPTSPARLRQRRGVPVVDIKGRPKRPEPQADVDQVKAPTVRPGRLAKTWRRWAENLRSLGQRRLGRRWRRTALIGLLWSVAMIWLGYWLEPHIDQLRQRIRSRFAEPTQAPVDMNARFLKMRQHAAAHPDDLVYWNRLAYAASHYGRDIVSIVAHRYLIARKPQDARLLNNLAWLHCTARDPFARDPVQALALAERAYAIDQAPYITDTLAEAAFQNGDVKRAIALEEDALARTKGKKGFYRRQLAKFRRRAKSATAAPSGSANVISSASSANSTTQVSGRADTAQTPTVVRSSPHSTAPPPPR